MVAPAGEGKPLVDGLEGDPRRFLDEHAIRLVAEYFLSGHFTGRVFNNFAGGGDAPPYTNAFTVGDVVAITMLGVRLPGRGVLELLDGRFNDLLAAIPANIDLSDPQCPEEVVGPQSAAFELWTRLRREVHGAGSVVAHKLCARKRPRLLPVYDDVLKQALQPSRATFRVPLWRELRDEMLVKRLRDIRTAAGLDDRVPLLRVLDVAVWMRNEGISQVDATRLGVTPLPFVARTG
jgi:hypothetical protein